MSNRFELPHLVIKTDNVERANKLHDTLLEDLREKNFDTFADRHNPTIDKAYVNSLRLVQNDDIVRSTLSGPSIQREKYSSTYWRNWNKEKNLLEDISYDEIIKQNINSYMSSTTRKSVVHNRTSEAKNISMVMKLKRKQKSDLGRNTRSVAFAAPGYYEKRSQYADPNLTGDNSVEFLMKTSLKQRIPRDNRLLHATIQPDDIGNRPIKGGGLSQAKKIQHSKNATITSKCDYPPLETPINPHKGSMFGTNPRFPTSSNNTTSSSLLPSGISGIDSSILSSIEHKTAGPSIVFDRAERFSDKDVKPSVLLRIPVSSGDRDIGNTPIGSQEDIVNKDLERPLLEEAEEKEEEEDSSSRDGVCTTNHSKEQQQEYIEYEYFPGDRPGPGQYDVPRLFDENKGKSGADFDALIEKYSSIKPGLLGLSCEKLSGVGLFGQQCNRQEHVLYGMCLDGRCCRRSEVEQFIVRRNDLRRLAGYGAVEKRGRNKTGLVEDMAYSAAMRDLLPEAEYTVQPLYAAAYNGDIAAIRSLAALGVDPNVRHAESGYTALHAAAFRCKLDATAALLSYFRGRLHLQIQDNKGDTPLHIASHMGFVEITSLICDEETCDPLAVANKAGQYPIDVVRSHKVWQMIKVCQTRNELRQELRSLQK